MGARGGEDMVDVVLDEEPEPQDPSPTPRVSPMAAVRRGVDGLRHLVRHHDRAVAGGLTVLALVVASAGAASVVATRADQRAVDARMASIDGAVLGSPTALRVLWTLPSDDALLGIGSADGLWFSVSEDRTALLARDADTGESRWRTDLPDGEAFSQCVTSATAVRAVACVVGHGDTFSLVAVSADDGSELGRTLLPDTAPPTLVATDDIDVVLLQAAPDGSGTVTRRSPLDGTERWSTGIAAPSTPPGEPGLGTTVQGGLLAFSGALDAVLELDTGSVVDVSPEPSSDGPSVVTLSPLPGGGVALWRYGFNAPGGTGTVLDADGGVRFSLTDQPLTVYPDDASGPDSVLVTPGQSVQGLDARTGEVLWTRAAWVSQAVRYDGALTLVLGGLEDSSVQQLDPGDGEPAWTVRWPGVSAAQSFLVGGSLLLAGTSAEARAEADPDGGVAPDRLAQVDLQDGTLRELPWPEGLTGSAWFSVQDHRLYASSADQPGLIRIG